MKRIVILGAGESGVGAAILAQKKGFDVFVSDMSAVKDKYKRMLTDCQIPFEELQHTESLILNADEVIKSPGIPDKAPVIKQLKEKNIPIISEIEFAARYTHAKMICITGSNGKTTTTMLIWQMLKDAGLNVGLAGNVGTSLALQVAEHEYDYYVVELSSFQLDNMYNFRAHIAILLNITPDHLDRYDYKMQNYVDSKFRITQNQTAEDFFIYWNEDPVIAEEIKKRKFGAQMIPFSQLKHDNIRVYVENDKLHVDIDEDPFEMELGKLALSGTHNLYNSMAASISAKVLHIQKEDIRKSLSNFQGVEHRLEKVATIRGVQYVNDSKATNVNSCWYALESMTTPTVLILGGVDKGNDYSEIEELVRKKVKAMICLGMNNDKLHDYFDSRVSDMFDTTSMKEAVQIAYDIAQKGDTVLLSPCCASFDLFKNYEDRGEQFKQCVKQL
ncbi:MAG: UDP-N-acetylmuramoyl-L-alanine--D-glutamate ligase [Bacteroidales bacterium]